MGVGTGPARGRRACSRGLIQGGMETGPDLREGAAPRIQVVTTELAVSVCLLDALPSLGLERKGDRKPLGSGGGYQPQATVNS